MQKLFSSIPLCIVFLFLVGCAGKSTIQIAEPVQVELPDAVAAAEDIYTEEAIKEFEAAVKVLRKGNTDEAELIFQDYVKKYPLVAGGYLNLALIDFQRGEFKTSEMHLDKAIELSPRNAIAYNLKGKLQRDRGEILEARVSYTKALVADPSYAPAHLNIAILYDIYLQYLLDARTHYKTYLELNGQESKTVKLWLQDLEFRIKQAGG